MLQGLISAARDRKIKLRIVNSIKKTPSNDTVNLINAGSYQLALCTNSVVLCRVAFIYYYIFCLLLVDLYGYLFLMFRYS